MGREMDIEALLDRIERLEARVEELSSYAHERVTGTELGDNGYYDYDSDHPIMFNSQCVGVKEGDK